MDVPKAKIKSTEIIGSLMPAGLVEALSEGGAGLRERVSGATE